MTYKNLAALHVLEPAKAKQQIKAALRKSENLSDAAEELKISVRQLHRWLAKYPELVARKGNP